MTMMRRKEGMRSPRNLFGLRSAGELFARSGRTVRSAWDGAAPRGRFDRRGFFGREADGGIARFRRLSAHLDQTELEALCFAYERGRTVYALAMGGSALAIPVSGLFGLANWAFTLGLTLLALFAGLKALQADFAAWRFRQGRMAPPVEYLNHRLPPNMQIMED